MQRIIIDTDPGVDDAHAILMALAHPDAKVEALTTVNGNVGVEQTTVNALKILDVAGADVPVYKGCAAPLVVPSRDAAYVHGTDGLGDADFPESKRQAEKEHASVALVRMANESPGEITLVAIGPLTNLAVALRLDPALPSKFKKLLIMGGAIHSRGNVENITAEFNVWADPEAAHVVLDSWPLLTMLSWETTVAYGISMDQVDRYFELSSQRSQFYKRSKEKVLAFLREALGREMLFEADGLAMACALEPGIVTKAETHHVTVEMHGHHTRGQTSVDWMDRKKLPANVEIILEVERERFDELIESGVH